GGCGYSRRMAGSADKFADIPTQQQARPREALGEEFELRIAEGPDRGAAFRVDASQPRMLMGLSPACEVRLTDPLVSRRHASLQVEGGLLRLTDLSSTNGTRVEGLAVFDAGLKGGERIRLGGTAIDVIRIEEGKRRAPPQADGFGRLVGASLEMRRLYPI